MWSRALRTEDENFHLAVEDRGFDDLIHSLVACHAVALAKADQTISARPTRFNKGKPFTIRPRLPRKFASLRARMPVRRDAMPAPIPRAALDDGTGVLTGDAALEGGVHLSKVLCRGAKVGRF